MLENKESWRLLCEQAVNERDPEKLVVLVKEINDLLEEKERRLKDSPLPGTALGGGLNQ